MLYILLGVKLLVLLVFFVTFLPDGGNIENLYKRNKMFLVWILSLTLIVSILYPFYFGSYASKSIFHILIESLLYSISLLLTMYIFKYSSPLEEKEKDKKSKQVLEISPKTNSPKHISPVGRSKKLNKEALEILEYCINAAKNTTNPLYLMDYRNLLNLFMSTKEIIYYNKDGNNVKMTLEERIQVANRVGLKFDAFFPSVSELMKQADPQDFDIVLPILDKVATDILLDYKNNAFSTEEKIDNELEYYEKNKNMFE